MEWIKIFSSSEEAIGRFGGQPALRVVIGEERICLAQHQGRFFAVQDACSHNGESLSGGAVNYLGHIVCPWHNYRFDLASGKACDSDCSDLKTYPVRNDASGIFIGI